MTQRTSQIEFIQQELWDEAARIADDSFTAAAHLGCRRLGEVLNHGDVWWELVVITRLPIFSAINSHTYSILGGSTTMMPESVVASERPDQRWEYRMRLMLMEEDDPEAIVATVRETVSRISPNPIVRLEEHVVIYVGG